ncbi:MAG TPA: GNAT family N-acetyltransferase [Gaiellales bacterium]|jgi:L-amino acid N-acyltransferase YncA|nr:GNAT family N-acetyltransferase [Gaiellales bacterium]
MPIEIDAMTAGDWPQVAEIYRQGLETGNASFETEVPAPEAWDAAHLPEPRLVARLDGAIAGWAALSAVSGRCVYGGVAEVSVYVAAGSAGRGVGRRLLSELVRLSEEAGIWTLQAGIFPENTASLTLHERCGFRVVGRRERLGCQNGVWRDVVLVERRSATVG